MKSERKFIIRQSCLLLLTAIIWGVAFVAQRLGMDYVGPYTFNAARFFLGGLTLLPLSLSRVRGDRRLSGEKGKEGWKKLLTAGLLCGLSLGAASSLQQVGILYTTVGKAGFLTAMYIVLVPVLGLFLGKRVKYRLWISVVTAAGGIYLLSMAEGEGLSMGKGDALCLGCAFLFAVQILLVDHFAPEVDGVLLSEAQFLGSCLLSVILMLLFERPSLHALFQASFPILYAGVLSCGVGYTLQIIGQRGMNPTLASLIMSLESTVSAVAGFLLLGQSLSGREIWGCCLMGAAIVLAQL